MFGKKITIDHRLVREYGEKGSKFWSKSQSALTEVMIIGERTLSDGVHIRSGYGEDYESYYVPHKYFKAFLVVANLRTNPFYVLCDKN